MSHQGLGALVTKQLQKFWVYVNNASLPAEGNWKRRAFHQGAVPGFALLQGGLRLLAFRDILNEPFEESRLALCITKCPHIKMSNKGRTILAAIVHFSSNEPFAIQSLAHEFLSLPGENEQLLPQVRHFGHELI